MSARARKLIGGVVMIAFVGVYALIAMALAQSRPLQEAPPLLQTLGYIALGLAWTLPLMPLIKWMERPDRRG
jgi:nucleoside permease NupC